MGRGAGTKTAPIRVTPTRRREEKPPRHYRGQLALDLPSSASAPVDKADNPLLLAAAKATYAASDPFHKVSTWELAGHRGFVVRHERHGRTIEDGSYTSELEAYERANALNAFKSPA